MTHKSPSRRPRHAAADNLPRSMLKMAEVAHEVKVASPYVTDLRLFNKCRSSERTLFTVFDSLNFICGASSLRVLRILHESGVNIFHVAFLHAKIVLIDGKYFSVGSQNMTVKWRRQNIEASFIYGNDSPSNEVIEFFDRITKIARPISLQEILDMEEMTKPWIKKFKDFKTAARAIDDHVKAKAERREASKQRILEYLKKQRKEQEKKKSLRSPEMKRALDLLGCHLNTPECRSSQIVIAAVQRLTNRARDIMYGRDTYTDSLRPINRNVNFESLLSSIGITPKRFKRYLLINTDNGRLGLVRFAKTQWTIFRVRLPNSV